MKRQSFNEGWTCNGEKVRLPHDAMIHRTRLKDAPSGSGGAYFPGGKYVYEKHFDKPDAPHAILEFEAVYKNARVFINDQFAGGRDYGYLPFTIEADAFMKCGDNVIRVECENIDQPDSRWYTGAGIYRPVWLWTGPRDGIAPHSVKVTTVSYDPPVIRIQSLRPIVFSIAGQTGEGTDFTMRIENARLWSGDDPFLYTARIKSESDEDSVTFGIRQLFWSRQGFFVNGNRTFLRGGCVHHDQGILGSATYDESEYRRVKILKKAGFNALRSAHNPAGRALLDACDRLGVYVIDEAWDMWFYHKNEYDYASLWQKNHMKDLSVMVGNDYNHPSVIMYSLGNEVAEPAVEKGLNALKEMRDYLHALDPSRPVTAGFNLMIIDQAARHKKGVDNSDKYNGMNSTMFNLITSSYGLRMNKAADGKRADQAVSPALSLLDICGYNYADGRYRKDGKLHPERVIAGTEAFAGTVYKHAAFAEKHPYIIGDFIWTAWDYLGEAGLGAYVCADEGKQFLKPYPWLLAGAGVFDILGNPDGEALHIQAAWGVSKQPLIAVRPLNINRQPFKSTWRSTDAIPSWSWSGREGKRAVAEVYTRAYKVELTLNGRWVGVRRTKEAKAVFRLKYEPGTLTVVAKNKTGVIVGRASLSSAVMPLKLTVRPKKQTVIPGEVIYVPINVEGTNQVIESNADRPVKVRVEGGRLLGLGSANPQTEERFDGNTCTTYYGRMLAIVRAEGQENVTIRATDTESTASAVIEVKK